MAIIVGTIAVVGGIGYVIHSIVRKARARDEANSVVTSPDQHELAQQQQQEQQWTDDEGWTWHRDNQGNTFLWQQEANDGEGGWVPWLE